MLIFLYLLTQTSNSIHLSNGENITFIILCIIELLVYIAPLVINFYVQKLYHQNTELKKELAEIKNLMIYQNDILNSMRMPQYYQQQPNNQNYQQQTFNNNGNNNFS